MSVVLLGDGTITSSIALTTLTLGNPVSSNPPSQYSENREVQKSDGGVITLYKKGRMALNHTLKIPWLSKTDVENILRFFATVDSSNWFTLQDHFVGYKSAFAHGTVPSQKIEIYNPVVDTNWIYQAIGLTAFCMSVVGGGGNTGERKRIVSQGVHYIEVFSPGFTNDIQIGDTFLLGIPVIFSSPPRIEPMSYNSWKVELNFEEMIY